MPETRTVHRYERVFSLSTLLLLIAVCAVFLGLVSPALRGILTGDLDLAESAVAAIVGGMVLGATGLFVGLFHYSKLNATLMGVLIGILLGAAIGALAAVSSDSFATVLVAAAINAALIVGLAAGIRLSADDWKKSMPGERPRVPRSVAVPRPQPQPKPHPLDPDPADGDE